MVKTLIDAIKLTWSISLIIITSYFTLVLLMYASPVDLLYKSSLYPLISIILAALFALSVGIMNIVSISMKNSTVDIACILLSVISCIILFTNVNVRTPFFIVVIGIALVIQLILSSTKMCGING